MERELHVVVVLDHLEVGVGPCGLLKAEQLNLQAQAFGQLGDGLLLDETVARRRGSLLRRALLALHVLDLLRLEVVLEAVVERDRQCRHAVVSTRASTHARRNHQRQTIEGFQLEWILHPFRVSEQKKKQNKNITKNVLIDDDD